MKHIYKTAISVRLSDIPDHPNAFTIKVPEPPNGDESDQAFLFRYRSQIYGYINRCSHVKVPLDMDDGRFFDQEGLIICRVHGARFAPESGLNLTGPAPFGLHRLLLKTTKDTVQIEGWIL